MIEDVFFRSEKKTAFFVLLYLKGVLKDYGSMCAFKITTIFLSKPFVGDAIAKGI